MKRFILIDLLWVGLIVLAGLTWSLHDQSEYADRLNHYGLSETAVRFTGSSGTVQEAAQALATSDLKDVQVQFQTATQPPLNYLYATGDYGSLPMTSGQWFTPADLKSPLPVMVIGKDREASVYTGVGQRYWPLNARYLPVIGMVGTRQKSPLNQVLFANATAAPPTLTLKQVTVIADGPNIKHQTDTLKRLLHATKTTRFTYIKGALERDWWGRNGLTVLASVGLAVVAAALGVLTAFWRDAKGNQGLDAALRIRLIRGLWTRAALRIGLATFIGVALSWWWFYLSDQSRLAVFACGLWLVYTLVVRGVVHRRERSRQ